MCVVIVSELREKGVPVALILREVRLKRSGYHLVIPLGLPVGLGVIRHSEDVIDPQNIAECAKERRDEFLPPFCLDEDGYAIVRDPCVKQSTDAPRSLYYTKRRGLCQLVETIADYQNILITYSCATARPEHVHGNLLEYTGGGEQIQAPVLSCTLADTLPTLGYPGVFMDSHVGPIIVTLHGRVHTALTGLSIYRLVVAHIDYRPAQLIGDHRWESSSSFYTRQRKLSASTVNRDFAESPGPRMDRK